MKSLKHERQKLVQENSRLREELEKAQQARPRRPKVVVEPKPEGPKVTGLKCPSCGGNDCRRVDLGPHGKFIICPACKFRARAPEES